MRVAANASNSFKAESDGASVGVKYPFVVAEERRKRHRLRRGEGEVVEDPAIGRDLAVLCPRPFEPLRQGLAGGRMLVLTQPQKILGLDFARQSQAFRTQPEPLTRHRCPSS